MRRRPDPLGDRVGKTVDRTVIPEKNKNKKKNVAGHWYSRFRYDTGLKWRRVNVNEVVDCLFVCSSNTFYSNGFADGFAAMPTHNK